MDRSPKKRTESNKRTTVPRIRTEVHQYGLMSDEGDRSPRGGGGPKPDKRTLIPRVRTEVHQCGLESKEWTEVQRREPSPISG